MSTRIEQKVDSVLSPIQAFIRDETVASGLLFVATVIAMILANSVWAESYFSFLELPLSISAGSKVLHFDFHMLVNDGLMTIFFLVLGLEIKRELLVGELQNPRLALTVLAAALGGMVAPAAIYLVINAQSPALSGWGIPMATDTAFALGVLMLLGDRVPQSLKAFLVAFAIMDDLGAILVIALFYTSSLDTHYLTMAMLPLLALLACNIIGLRHIAIYLILGVVLWSAVVAAGIHGTVAGVLVAATVPARPKRGRRWFVRNVRQLATRVESLRDERAEEGVLSDPEQHEALEAAQQVAKIASTPLRRWERSLERPVLLFILPLFALTNAGISISHGLITEVVKSSVTWGIVLGLLLGKVAGISLLIWLCVRSGAGLLPSDMTLNHVIGVAILGGMGFTMSLFITELSFSSETFIDSAKIAILSASVLAGALGFLWLRYNSSKS